MKRFSLLLIAAAFAVPPVIAAEIHRADQAPGAAEEVELGKQLYAMCAGCHGPDGEGQVGIAPAFNSQNYLAAASNDFFKETLVKGRAGTNMVAFGAGMPDENVDALVSYIRSLQTVPGIELDESPLKGDVETGEEYYRAICATCHGRSGAGYSELSSGTGIGRVDFLNVASDGFIRATVKHGKDNTQMRSFSTGSPVAVADLTDEQIDSIIQYLRANAW